MPYAARNKGHAQRALWHPEWTGDFYYERQVTTRIGGAMKSASMHEFRNGERQPGGS